MEGLAYELVCQFNKVSSSATDTYEFRAIHKITFGQNSLYLRLNDSDDVVEYPFSDLENIEFSSHAAISTVASDYSSSSLTYRWDETTAALTVISTGEPITDIVVYNVSGMTYSRIAPDATEGVVSLSDCDGGIYLIRISTASEVKVVKVKR